jgi:hypothetical protein
VDQFNLTPRDIFHSFATGSVRLDWLTFFGLVFLFFGYSGEQCGRSSQLGRTKQTKKNFIIISEYKTESESSDFFNI